MNKEKMLVKLFSKDRSLLRKGKIRLRKVLRRKKETRPFTPHDNTSTKVKTALTHRGAELRSWEYVPMRLGQCDAEQRRRRRSDFLGLVFMGKQGDHHKSTPAAPAMYRLIQKT